MKRRQRHQEPTVSLFPFLTVLICTIGMLIVLLVISVRAIGDKAQRQRELSVARQKETLEQTRAMIEFEQLRREGYSEVRKDLAAKLQSTRLERGYLEDAIQELETEAQAVALQLKEAFSESEERDSTEQIQIEIGELSQQLADAERELADRPTVAAPTVYNLIPYAGPNSTSRRPIYVECVSQKLVLQPSGIELNLTDFAAPSEPGNPLDAALTTIREYWVKYDLAGEHGEPYPLLVVRPSGSQAYGLARRAMTSWVDEFGYELISEDKQINFGVNDPQLAVAVEKAVSASKSRQQALAREIRSRERILQQREIERQLASGGGGLRVDRVRGGFVKDSIIATPETVPAQKATSTADTNPVPKLNSKPRTADTKSGTSNSSGQRNTESQTTQSGPSRFGALHETQSLADSRGADWALPQRNATRATGYRRPIRVFCSADELVIDPGSNHTLERNVIAFTDSTFAAVDPLVGSLQQLIEQWGQPPENSYWKPELKFELLPGGARRMHEMRILMRGSGIDISGDSP